MVLLHVAILLYFCIHDSQSSEYSEPLDTTNSSIFSEPIYAANSSIIEVMCVLDPTNPVQNYSLGYSSHSNISDNSCYWNAHINHSDILHEYIRGLQTDTWYRVTLDVYFQNNTHKHYENDVKTLSRIGKIDITANVSSNNITLQWYRPLTDWYRQLVKTQYNCPAFLVAYHNNTVRSTSPIVNLTKLRCYREYTINIYFCNISNCNCMPAVGPLSLQTSMCSPGMVSNIRIKPLNATHSKMFWTSPRNLNGPSPIYFVERVDTEHPPTRTVTTSTCAVIMEHICKNNPADASEQSVQYSISAVNMDNMQALSSPPLNFLLPCTRYQHPIWQIIIVTVLMLVISVRLIMHFVRKTYKLYFKVKSTSVSCNSDQTSSDSEMTTLEPLERKRTMTI